MSTNVLTVGRYYSYEQVGPFVNDDNFLGFSVVLMRLGERKA